MNSTDFRTSPEGASVHHVTVDTDRHTRHALAPRGLAAERDSGVSPHVQMVLRLVDHNLQRFALARIDGHDGVPNVPRIAVALDELPDVRAYQTRYVSGAARVATTGSCCRAKFGASLDVTVDVIRKALNVPAGTVTSS